MTDPAALPAAVTAAWLSSVSLALFGVDYYAIVWGMGGALVMLAWSEPMGRWRAILTVWASTLTAAALAHTLADMAGGDRKFLIGAAFLLGLGAQPITQAAVEALAARLRRWGAG
ncbi:MAG: hypothetical protein WCS09_02750 [Pseudomonadota bacterium]|jgi:hypothetical protein